MLHFSSIETMDLVSLSSSPFFSSGGKHSAEHQLATICCLRMRSSASFTSFTSRQMSCSHYSWFTM